MKLSDIENIYENYDTVTKFSDLDHFFNIYVDDAGKYKYNLNSSIYFEIPYQQLSKYVVDGYYHWPLISYKLYGTTRLAWLLMKLNQVKAEEVFARVPAGMQIVYLTKTEIQNILEQLTA